MKMSSVAVNLVDDLSVVLVPVFAQSGKASYSPGEREDQFHLLTLYVVTMYNM